MRLIGSSALHVPAFLLPAAFVLTLVALAPPSAMAQPSAPPPSQPATIYWCPDRPADRQIAARPEPGCAPLAESSTQQGTGAGDRQKRLPPIKLEDIQSASAQFLKRYNDFLDCCADDLAELDLVKDLETEASNILRSIQASGIYHAGTVVRQYTLGEIVRQIAQSHRDLTTLHARLERIGKGMDRLEGHDSERAGREARELEADREGIAKDFRPSRPPSSARTGVNIEDTTVPNRYGESPTGASTLRSTTGAEIGGHSDLRPRPGEAIRDSTLSERYGTSAEDTTIPNSTGFGIGSRENSGGSSTTPTRVGPDLGDSSLNR